MMTGVYRSGTEYALQLLKGSRSIHASMYYINAFPRYLKKQDYTTNSLKEIISKIRCTSSRYNLQISLSDVRSWLEQIRPEGVFSRSDIYHAIMYSLYLKNTSSDTWIEKSTKLD